MKKLLRIIAIVSGGLIIPFLTLRLPLAGPELFLEFLGCGEPSGLPFSFLLTSSPSQGAIPASPMCFAYDVVALGIDIVVWTTVLYVGFYLTKKYYRRKKEA